MSIYTPTARFDAAHALTEDEMRKSAPSIFAVSAHESRSARFAPIPTIEILRGLSAEGFVPVGVKQSRARDEGRREFTRHLIRLRRIDDDAKFRVGDVVTEILLKNANDGTAAYELMAGLFRIRCLNSLVAQTGTIDSVKVPHTGQAVAKVIEGTYRVLGAARGALAAPEIWGGLALDGVERDAFATAVHALRFGDASEATQAAIKPAALIAPRRADDRGTDLWTVLNVAQENAVRGGLHGQTRDPETRRMRRVSTREIRGIDQDVRLNRALWVLASKLAEHKGAAPIGGLAEAA